MTRDQGNTPRIGGGKSEEGERKGKKKGVQREDYDRKEQI